MKILLGIVGENLEPELVSAMLGGAPRKSGKKGEPVVAPNAAGQVITRPAIAGFWQRAVSVADGQAIEQAISALFEGLTQDEAPWQKLSSQYCAEIAVHGVSPQVTAQNIFSEQTLELFRRRGLQISLRRK